MNIQCPKCKKINPNTKEEIFTHYSIMCKTIIGVKVLLFGLWIKNIYCNHFLSFDLDDDYIEIKDNVKQLIK